MTIYNVKSKQGSRPELREVFLARNLHNVDMSLREFWKT